MNDRRKKFRVVDRDLLLHPTCLERSLVLVRVDTPNPPISVRCSQSIGDVAEVLAGSDSSEIEDGL